MFSLQIIIFLAISFKIAQSEKEMANETGTYENYDYMFRECLGDLIKYFPNAEKFEELDNGQYLWETYCQLYKLQIRNWCYNLNHLKTTEKQLSLNTTIRWMAKRQPKGVQGTFSVFAIEIYKFYQSEWRQDTIVDGNIDMSWEDERLMWTKNKTIRRNSCKGITGLKNDFSLNNPMLIHPLPKTSDQIWTPHIIFQGQEKHFVDFHRDDAYTFLVFPKGHVIWLDDFEAQHNCPMDFKNFPFDRHNCCISFEFALLPLQMDKQPKIILPKKSSGAWDVIKAKAYWEKYGDHGSFLKVCFMIKRGSTLIYYQLVLPLTATAFLTILGPLLGSWKIQLFLRIFSILLLIINLQETTGWHLTGFGKNPPRIVVVYDFYIWVTAVSLVISLGLWSTSKVKNRAKLPPGPLGMLGYWLNPWMPCTAVKGFQGQDAKSMAQEGQVNVKLDVDYAWQEALIGLNNVVSILVTVVYILGSIIIGAC